MGTIVVEIEALEGAIDDLETLAADVSSKRLTARGAVPSRVGLSALSAAGPAGTFEDWATEQIESPLRVVLDTAKLLQSDGETGPVTITYTGPYSITKVEDQLAELLSTALSSAESKTELESYLAMLAQHENNEHIQAAVVTTMGQAGIVSLLTRAGEAGLPMETVTTAFSAESEATIADWVRADVTDPQNIDTDTVTLLAGFSRSAEFSQSLFEHVTPDQMSEAIQYLNEETFANVTVVDGPDEDARDLYSKFINGAGTSFATYTKAVDDPEALASTWFDAITDDDHKENASALTFLIRKGGENTDFDPDFLYTLTEDVYQWELDQDGAVWSPRDSGTQLWDPDTFSLDTDHQIRMSDRSDGLANLFGSTEYTPEAAQRFFANGYEDGTPGDGESNSRLEYLLSKRTFDGADGSDNGYGLGVLLEAAASGNTTHDYVYPLGYSDEWSAGFATELFGYVADHDEAGQDGLFDNKFHGLPGTSVAYGNIAAAYADDVYDIADNESFVPTGDTDLRIDAETLQTVIGQIGHHDDMSGLETLSTALMAEGNERFRTLLENNPGEHTLASLEGLDPQGILDSNGEVVGKVLTWGLESKMSGEELERTRAEFAAKAFDIATDFIPGVGKAIPAVKDTLWETTIDAAKSAGINELKDAIKESPDPTSGEYADIQNQQFEDLIRYNTYDQLLATGYLDDQDIPDVLIVGEGENRRFRTDIRFDGVDGLPDPDEEGISAAQARARREERAEVQEAINYLLTNDPDVNGPGASLQGLLTDALNGYDRVKPDPAE